MIVFEDSIERFRLLKLEILVFLIVITGCLELLNLLVCIIIKILNIKKCYCRKNIEYFYRK